MLDYNKDNMKATFAWLIVHNGEFERYADPGAHQLLLPTTACKTENLDIKLQCGRSQIKREERRVQPRWWNMFFSYENL